MQLKGEFDNQFIYQRWDPETVWGDLKGKSDYWIGDAKKCNRVDIEVKYQENLQKWGIAPYHIENAAKENADLLYVTDGEILEEYNMHTKQRKYLADISEYWQNYCKAIAEHKILTPKIKISTRK